jgi:aryl-alcohol dehydrogenase-like predicted oxidoreductase
MRKVSLAPGVGSSVLGFGCAPILGSIGPAEAKRAMSCALDAGVNHFDVARCYGYGDAERFVGRFLKPRRESVVIASKFGLEATGAARLLRPAKPLIRLLRRRRRSAEMPTGAQAAGSRGPFLRGVPITATDMEKSLERSLRALGTDYLDIFLLHEPDWSNLPTDEIVASAEKLKRQGKIRAFGAAFYREEKMPTEAEGNVFDLLQFDCPRAGSVYDLVEKERGGMANVIFSPSRAGFVGLDFTDVLARLWADFPRSVVLSSMFDPDHIRANAAKAAL